MFTKCSEIHAYNTSAANAGNYVTTKIRTEKGNKPLNRLGSQSIESFQEKNAKFVLDRDKIFPFVFSSDISFHFTSILITGTNQSPLLW